MAPLNDRDRLRELERELSQLRSQLGRLPTRPARWEGGGGGSVASSGATAIFTSTLGPQSVDPFVPDAAWSVRIGAVVYADGAIDWEKTAHVYLANEVAEFDPVSGNVHLSLVLDMVEDSEGLLVPRRAVAVNATRSYIVATADRPMICIGSTSNLAIEGGSITMFRITNFVDPSHYEDFDPAELQALGHQAGGSGFSNVFTGPCSPPN